MSFQALRRSVRSSRHAARYITANASRNAAVRVDTLAAKCQTRVFSVVASAAQQHERSVLCVPHAIQALCTERLIWLCDWSYVDECGCSCLRLQTPTKIRTFSSGSGS